MVTTNDAPIMESLSEQRTRQYKMAFNLQQRKCLFFHHHSKDIGESIHVYFCQYFSIYAKPISLKRLNVSLI